MQLMPGSVKSGEGRKACCHRDLGERFTAFYHAAYADGEVDSKSKILIGMAVASAAGCYP
jgi:alkylhydroperoxidase/carboxymuconolactone decarboxylase family protein YurZ